MPLHRERLAPAVKAAIPPQVGELIVVPFDTTYFGEYKRISLMCYRREARDLQYSFTSWIWDKTTTEPLFTSHPNISIPKKKLKDIVW